MRLTFLIASLSMGLAFAEGEGRPPFRNFRQPVEQFSDVQFEASVSSAKSEPIKGIKKPACYRGPGIKEKTCRGKFYHRLAHARL